MLAIIKVYNFNYNVYLGNNKFHNYNCNFLTLTTIIKRKVNIRVHKKKS